MRQHAIRLIVPGLYAKALYWFNRYGVPLILRGIAHSVVQYLGLSIPTRTLKGLRVS